MIIQYGPSLSWASMWWPRRRTTRLVGEPVAVGVHDERVGERPHPPGTTAPTSTWARSTPHQASSISSSAAPVRVGDLDGAAQVPWCRRVAVDAVVLLPPPVLVETARRQHHAAGCAHVTGVPPCFVRTPTTRLSSTSRSSRERPATGSTCCGPPPRPGRTPPAPPRCPRSRCAPRRRACGTPSSRRARTRRGGPRASQKPHVVVMIGMAAGLRRLPPLADPVAVERLRLEGAAHLASARGNSRGSRGSGPAPCRAYAPFTKSSTPSTKASLWARLLASSRRWSRPCGERLLAGVAHAVGAHERVAGSHMPPPDMAVLPPHLPVPSR